MNEIRYFSMFTGVGGFELGLSCASNRVSDKIKTSNRKGMPLERSESMSSREIRKNRSKYTFNPVGFSEINKYASELLAKRFPNIKNFGDATKINPYSLPEFDMLCGGFPCQAFSIAGKRRGFNDTRGTMFFEIARILEVKRPRIVLLENVKGLLNHEKGQTFRVILQTLEELGYEVQWMVLNSKFFGVPQNRERVFIIGSLRGEPRPEILPFGCSDQNPDEQNTEVCQCHQARYSKGSNGTHIHPVLTPDRPTKRQNGRRFKEDGEPSFTLTGQDIHGISDGIKIRRLTPTECELLQGFPEGWTEGFSDTQRYKMMGNAVTVNVIEAIGRKLIKLQTR